MSKWSLHTPVGLNDILPYECNVKKEIERRIDTVFESMGYEEVQTPTFEYYDVFADDGGLIEQEAMFKFFDEKGRVLTLRPDITTSIARMVATKYSKEKLPVRFRYTGNVFRHENAQVVRQREFTQAGIELIGVKSAMADAEVIMASIEAVMATGLDEFQVELGQVGFFNGLVRQVALSNDEIENIRSFIDAKDSLAIEQYIKDKNIDDNIKRLLIELPYMFGDITVIEKAKIDGLNETSKQALENIKEVYDILTDYGMQNYISVDLGMLQSIDYYTGLIFKGFTYGVGFSIFAGGRYDNLINRFGASLPAVGVSFGINMILSALHRNNKIDTIQNAVDTLVVALEGAYKEAYLVSSSLRVQGVKVEIYADNTSLDVCKEYAVKKNIGGIVAVDKTGKIQLVNIATGDVQITSIDTLINTEVEG